MKTKTWEIYFSYLFSTIIEFLKSLILTPQLLEALQLFELKLGSIHLEEDRDSVLTFQETLEQSKSSRASTRNNDPMDDMVSQILLMD